MKTLYRGAAISLIMIAAVLVSASVATATCVDSGCHAFNACCPTAGGTCVSTAACSAAGGACATAPGACDCTLTARAANAAGS